MQTVAQRLILVFMLVGVLAITSAFIFRTFALFSWLLALAAIIAASIILLRQPDK
jgi:hypothetical protein